jgi:hypothetical protein
MARTILAGKGCSRPDIRPLQHGGCSGRSDIRQLPHRHLKNDQRVAARQASLMSLPGKVVQGKASALVVRSVVARPKARTRDVSGSHAVGQLAACAVVPGADDTYVKARRQLEKTGFAAMSLTEVICASRHRRSGLLN